MGMQEFVKKWNGVSVEDDGCYMSGEGKRFVTQFRNALKKDLPDAEITIKPGHYDLYGFVSENGHTAYVSYNIPRYGLPVNTVSYTGQQEIRRIIRADRITSADSGSFPGTCAGCWRYRHDRNQTGNKVSLLLLMRKDRS